MVYEIIDVNLGNVDQIGLFCKQSQKKEEGYQNKIEWIKKRFSEGLKYKILKVKETTKYSYRGFIEYIPSEFNWRGIKAVNFMVIHCVWVVGKHKKKGYASEMIQMALDDAKAQSMNGVVGMSAEKGGWLPRRTLYEKMGFIRVDEYGENIGLYAKLFSKQASKPDFYPITAVNKQKYGNGVTLSYTHQCPYMPALIDDVEQFAKNNGLNFQSKLINSASEAQQNGIYPYGTYCILCNGELLSYKPNMRKKTLEKLQSQI